MTAPLPVCSAKLSIFWPGWLPDPACQHWSDADQITVCIIQIPPSSICYSSKNSTTVLRS
eukprot:scaffold240551_cov67-Attheya_sp.AAC.5